MLNRQRIALLFFCFCFRFVVFIASRFGKMSDEKCLSPLFYPKDILRLLKDGQAGFWAFLFGENVFRFDDLNCHSAFFLALHII